MNRSLRTAFLSVSLALAAASASASPLITEPMLAPTVARSLATQVRVERVAHPDAFANVQHLAGMRRAVYGTSRAGRPSVVRELRAMGPSALLPMLDTLFVSGYAEPLDATEHAVLTQALVEAIGSLRDRRAEPALRGIFLSATDPDLLRAAALGLGGLCTDAEVTLLTTHARGARSDRRDAALEGLGTCRTLASVRALVDLLDHSPDDAAVIAASRGLSNAASASAALAMHTRDDLGGAAAPALVRAFARTQGEARREVQLALLTLRSPRVPELLAQAAAATSDPALRRATLSMESITRRELQR